MNKTELATALAERTGITKAKANDVLTALVDVTTEQLKAGGFVNISGFVKVAVRESAARDGRNPQTGETIKIAARKTPKVTVSKGLKDAVR